MQQVGIGVKDVIEAWKWYIKVFGVDVKIFDDEGIAERMLPYTAGKPQPRRAILALNMRGGGGFEIWQPKGRDLNYIKEEAILGDLGIFTCKIKCLDVNTTFNEYKKLGVNILNKLSVSPAGLSHFYIKDPYNNLFEIEEDNYVLCDEPKLTGGANGVVLGVSDMDKSIRFYSDLMDYDTVVSDTTAIFDDLQGVAGAANKLRRVILKRSKPLYGPLCEIMGTSHLELIQNLDTTPKKIYEGRLWGDPGFIHLCFDVRNMDCVKQVVGSMGKHFVCDGGRDFDMGDANGHFTYVEDPDGTLIEFVETFKVPIAKKLGLFIHLENKDDYKPLPRYITKALRFAKAKIK